MKRFVLALAIISGAVVTLGASTAQAQYGYYGTFRGGGRNTSYSHVRSFSSGGIFIQSYTPPSGYGYYGEAYGPAIGYGYGPGYGGYGPGYGNGPNCSHHHHQGYSPYGYGGYNPGIFGRW